jgi:hypothetical protein
MIKIWNKTESINGVSAQTVLNSRADLKNEAEIILIIDDNTGKVTNIEIPSVLKANLGLPNALTALEVGQAYVDFMAQEKQNAEQEAAIVETRLTQLEADNAQLTYALMMGGLL